MACRAPTLEGRIVIIAKKRKEGAMIDIKKVLFPVDFTKGSKKVLPFVKFFVDKCGAELHLVHVVRGPEDFTGFDMGAAWFSSFEQELIKGAQKAMDRFVSEELGDDPNVRTRILMGDAVDEITNYAAENAIDIIVMGTHGRKGLEKIMFGSVAEGVVKAASCPVITVNPYRVKM